MTTVMSKLSGAALQVGLTALLALTLPAYYVYKLTTYFLGAVFPEDVAGKVVLITGASSGIGEVRARILLPMFPAEMQINRTITSHTTHKA